MSERLARLGLHPLEASQRRIGSSGPGSAHRYGWVMGAMPAGVPVLRPLAVGEILDASFKMYRRNFVNMAKAILVVAIPFGLLSALIRASVSPSATNFSSISNPPANPTPSAASVAASLTTELVTILAAAVSTAVIYRVVGSAYLGNPSSWKEAVRSGIRKAYSVLWVTMLSIVIYGVIVVVSVVIIVLVAAHSAGLGVLVGFLLGVPAICALVWFWVVSQLAIPSLMLEGYKGSKALLRVARLVRHLWWRSFGCMLLVSLIVGILTSVVAGVIVALLLAFSNSDVATIAVIFVAGVITTVLFTPITASAYVVLSIDLRVRKEGYDIQLLANQLGSQPGSSALSFLPRPPVMWGGPTNGWGQPGHPGYPGTPWAGPWQPGGPQPPAQPGWGPPPEPGWGPPPQPGWGPPTQPPGPRQPGWGPPTQPGWGPPPPPIGARHLRGWVPPPSADWRPPPPTGWVQNPPAPGAMGNGGHEDDHGRNTLPLTGWVPPGQPEPRESAPAVRATSDTPARPAISSASIPVASAAPLTPAIAGTTQIRVPAWWGVTRLGAGQVGCKSSETVKSTS